MINRTFKLQKFNYLLVKCAVPMINRTFKLQKFDYLLVKCAVPMINLRLNYKKNLLPARKMRCANDKPYV
jgi:hypothetical protein